MRGDPARTVRGRRIQGEVAEYILTSKAGLTRRDIRGEERRGRHVERRHDLAATTRRTLASLGRASVAMGVATFGTFVAVTTLLSGLEATGLFLMVAAWVATAAVFRLPDVLFEEPAPKAVVTYSESPGMSDREYYRRLAIHGEREELKEEKIEKRRKRQERKAKAQGSGKF